MRDYDGIFLVLVELFFHREAGGKDKKREKRGGKEEETPGGQPPVQQEPGLNVRTLNKNALGKPTSRYKQAEAPQKTSELSMSHGQ